MTMQRLEHFTVPLWQIDGRRVSDIVTYVDPERRFSCECRIITMHGGEGVLLPIGPKVLLDTTPRH